MIVFACIAPHGDLDDMPELRSAMEELGRRFDAAVADVAIVVTPHNVHVQGHFVVVTAARVGEWETDRDVADALLAAEVPILGASYGGNVPAQSEMPLDWGTEVPLDFMRAERVVVVSPAREAARGAHRARSGDRAAPRTRRPHRLGRPRPHACSRQPVRVPSGGALYDERLLEILASDRLDFLPLAEHAEDGKADSLWQLLVLQGAVGEGARVDVLAYARRSYFGMLVAEVSA